MAKLGWEMFCAHANEVPNICPCPPDCGYREAHCAGKAQQSNIKPRMTVMQELTEAKHLIEELETDIKILKNVITDLRRQLS